MDCLLRNDKLMGMTGAFSMAHPDMVAEHPVEMTPCTGEATTFIRIHTGRLRPLCEVCVARHNGAVNSDSPTMRRIRKKNPGYEKWTRVSLEDGATEYATQKSETERAGQ